MATIDSLIPLIYHEKQQPGSMLCAQHALNNLLQGNYFAAPDLSTIANSLDILEGSYDEDQPRSRSTNMDDTGFFSVQVLEKALQVWGLTLVSWRSEAMQLYQDHPQTQMAFILNSQQHWYTLRRFGKVSPDPTAEADPGEGHWFNLNSFLPAPERVGKLYLGMVLHQAEQEGYSVFAVVQIDPEGPLALTRTEADDLAASIPESSIHSSYVPTASPFPTLPEQGPAPAGFEDEDMELQAALQASLMGGSSAELLIPREAPAPHRSFSVPITSPTSFSVPISSPGRASGGTRTPVQSTSYQTPAPFEEEEDEGEEELDEVLPHTATLPGAFPPRAQPPVDPLEASRARSQAYMEHVLREQQQALQEQEAVEAARVRAGLPTLRRGGDEEDEEFLRAIEESRAMAEAQQEADVDVEGEEEGTPPPVIPPRPFDSHRVYDDEDAELQAALRASLETVPEGFTMPETPPRTVPPPLQPRPAAGLPPVIPDPLPISSSQSQSTEYETESEADSNAMEEEPSVSLDEMRRRRLARFGGS